MRRSLLAVALVLSTGGWVCDSDGTCPSGTLTCPTDVADVCCPQGAPYRCGDTCSATPACSDYNVCTYPDDPGSGLCTAGAYAASVTNLTCTAPDGEFMVYRFSASGTLTGCGTTTVSIKLPQGFDISSFDCGTWSSQRSGDRTSLECTPGSQTPGGTTWQVSGSYSAVPGTPLDAVAVSLSIELGGAPVIAQAMQACPPLP
jgi:hypothetical protein